MVLLINAGDFVFSAKVYLFFFKGFCFTSFLSLPSFLLKSLAILTYYVQVPDLVLHRVRIYLTHVVALVRLLHVFDSQHPRPFIRMCYTHSMVLRYHVTLNS